VLPTLPSASVDAVITDPPYLGRDRNGRTLANDDKPSAVVGVYAELFRVLKPNSFCVLLWLSEA
jgi:DNA modification methylase